ncbi:MAG: hypothetical protein HAW67_01325 [Endozoicomonadaceae bacterium]|nr:hypothetical protein [Endozoicomonadaceae bacterium]
MPDEGMQVPSFNDKEQSELIKSLKARVAELEANNKILNDHFKKQDSILKKLDQENTDLACKVSTLSKPIEERKGYEGFIRAFWRRIEPFKDQYNKNLPSELPIEFKAHMATAWLVFDTDVDPSVDTPILTSSLKSIDERFGVEVVINKHTGGDQFGHYHPTLHTGHGLVFTHIPKDELNLLNKLKPSSNEQAEIERPSEVILRHHCPSCHKDQFGLPMPIGIEGTVYSDICEECQNSSKANTQIK